MDKLIYSLSTMDFLQVTSEYLHFDDEDQGNSNARSRISPYGAAEDPYNNRIYYCYYEPSKILLLSMKFQGFYGSLTHYLMQTAWFSIEFRLKIFICIIMFCRFH